jgi:hypothetical protein
MGFRKVKVRKDYMIPCEKCANDTDFTVISEQVAEDYCEVWARCACGNEPESLDRIEDVWGSLDDGNVIYALDVWNEWMEGKSQAGVGK